MNKFRERRFRRSPVNPYSFSLQLESLESRHLLAAAPLVISEFMASNDTLLTDGDGNSSDWIEVHNPTAATVDLNGWYLTDDATRLDKWPFPAVAIAPDEYLVVFASGQPTDHYLDGSGNLHTNFKLSAHGEYLGLTYADPETVLTAIHEYAPDYLPQYEDISYGIGLSVETETFIASGGAARVWVPTNDSVDDVWTETGFDDTSWTLGPTGVGYENSPADYSGLIATTVPLGTDTAYVRMDFSVTDNSSLNALKLRMKYDDGFIAYLNGDSIPVAQANAPADPDYLSVATGNHPDQDAAQFVDFDLTGYLGLLQDGKNVLAIHSLNQGSSSDMLLVPELVATIPTSGGLATGYFLSPTPGAENTTGIASPGPAIRQVTENPQLLSDGDDLIVTARVTELAAPIETVALHYRVMYDSEVAVAMVDDGSGSDAVADDGVFTAVIPHSASDPGDMLRWYVAADDSNGAPSRGPAFLDTEGKSQSPEYFGTVIADPTFNSALPFFKWFTQNESASHSRTGTRAAVLYNGNFYDNLFVRQRGGATNSSASQKFDFNKGQGLFVSDHLGTVGEINLNGNGSDSSYLRQPMGFDAHTTAGGAASASFHTTMLLNGSFDRVGVWVEQVDEDFLERQNYDPEGDLYKLVQRSNLNPGVSDITTGLEKKTGDESDLSTFQTLVNGLAQATETQRQQFLRDNVDIAQMVNYMAVRSLQHQADDIRKNMYLYQDTQGDGLWRLFPWDLDWTFNIVGGHDNQDSQRTEHPFFGTEDFPTADGHDQWNVLYDVLLETVEVQEMYLRRLRTLMDDFYGGPTGGTTWFADYVNTHFPDIDPHLGSSATSGKNSLLNSIEDRRDELYLTYTNNIPGYSVVIPAAQIADPQIYFGAVDFNPASGDQDQEYYELNNPNPFAVDISGWILTGGVSHTFQPGTVIAAGETLYVTPSVAAFRARAVGPGGGQSLFVQQSDAGHLSNFGETIHLLTADGVPVDTFTYAGDPSPAQQYLRITEINYHPYDALPQFGDATVENGFFEFVELVNTNLSETLDLAGVHFSEGIDFVFGAQDVVALLAPGERLLVVRDQAAFESRYGLGLNVAGEFQNDSALSNGGESIKLEDAGGSTILQFSYRDTGSWPGRADGKGATLESIELGSGIDASSLFDNPENWLSSNEFGGSPGNVGTGPVYDVLVNEVLSHSNGDLLDKIELFNATSSPIDLNGWHLSDTSTDYLRYTFGAGAVIGAGEYLTLDQHEFGFALDGQFGDDLWLLQGDPSDGDKPLRFADHQEFFANEANTSIGLWPDGDPGGTLFPMAFPTLGDANIGPVFGDLLITEIHYDPETVPPAEQANISQGELEFVELFNNRDSEVNISHWSLDGIEFAFPLGTSIAAGEAILVVTFDPVTEPAKADAFRRVLAAAGGVRLFGAASGRLDNAGERVTLLKPENATILDSGGDILVDTVRYDDLLPWPSTGDEAGLSLTRNARTDFAPLASSWTAAAASPGQVAFSNLVPGDYDRNGLVEQTDRTMWASWFGDSTNPVGNQNLLAADGNSDGIVDSADFTVWRDHLGQSASAPAVAIAEVVIDDLADSAKLRKRPLGSFGDIGPLGDSTQRSASGNRNVATQHVMPPHDGTSLPTLILRDRQATTEKHSALRMADAGSETAVDAAMGGVSASPEWPSVRNRRDPRQSHARSAESEHTNAYHTVHDLALAEWIDDEMGWAEHRGQRNRPLGSLWSHGVLA